jgi:O-antigen/teichoic acid export membrane protein
MSRARRVFMTGFWSAGTQVVGIVSQILVIPFFLRDWGTPRYSDWIELTALVSALQYADGGMQLHVANVLTQSAAQERWADFRRDLASATLMYAGATGVALVGTVGICGWIHFSHYFAGRPLEDEAVGIVALLGLQMTALLISGFMTSLYRSVGRLDFTQLAQFILRTGLLVTTLFVLTRQRGALTLAGAQLLIYLAVIAWLAIDARRHDSHLQLTFRGASFRRAREFLVPSLQFLFVGVAGGMTVQGIVLVVDALAPAALVQFTTTRTMTNAVRQLVALFANSTSPELTRLDAQGNRERLALANRLLTKLTCTVALPVIATLFFAGISVYELWTRGRAEPNEFLLRLLLLDVLATIPWSATQYVLLATSRMRDISRLYLLAGVAQVVLSIVGTKLLGVDGVGFAMLVVTLGLWGVLVPRWSMAVVGETYADYLRSILIPYVLVSAAVFAAVWGVDRHVWPSLAATAQLRDLAGWLGRHAARLAPVTMVLFEVLLDASVAVLLSAIFAWQLLFQAAERDLLVGSLRAVVQRRVAAKA